MQQVLRGFAAAISDVDITSTKSFNLAQAGNPTDAIASSQSAKFGSTPLQLAGIKYVASWATATATKATASAFEALRLAGIECMPAVLEPPHGVAADVPSALFATQAVQRQPKIAGIKWAGTGAAAESSADGSASCTSPYSPQYIGAIAGDEACAAFAAVYGETYAPVTWPAMAPRFATSTAAADVAAQSMAVQCAAAIKSAQAAAAAAAVTLPPWPMPEREYSKDTSPAPIACVGAAAAPAHKLAGTKCAAPVAALADATLPPWAAAPAAAGSAGPYGAAEGTPAALFATPPAGYVIVAQSTADLSQEVRVTELPA